ncbi:MAG: hypothetical protein M0Z49_15990 [Chloroflexi bacterium]|nr:hypothetical protein [Chloroflexota bacterium]
MCMNCGCGKPDDRHGSPDNITREDLERAARANGQSLDQAVRNIDQTTRSMHGAAGSSSASSGSMQG